MPNAVFIPAELNDLSVDVALGTPAQGAVLYRGAAKWNALAAGTSGKVLQTNGAGADPSWVTVDLTTLVTLAPNTPTRNTIQPAADGNRGLVINQFSPTQSVPLLQMGAALGVAAVVALNIGNDDRYGLVVQLSADATPGNFDTAFEVRNRSGAPQLTTYDSGNGGVQVLSQATTDSLWVSGFAGQTGPIFFVENAGFVKVFSVGDQTIGFFGTAPVVQQATASAAGIAGIRTDTLAHAVADIQTILTALRAPGVTFGLTANTA